MEASGFRHWRLETDIDNVAWLTLDRSGEKNNSLSRDVLEELQQVVTRLEQNNPAGLVLQSGKHESFIVGADVREFDDVSDAEQAADFIRHVHQLFNRIEALPFPTVAAIEGYCLGGGLELVLAFDYRVVRDIEATRIGFPEIKLGIYPGFGGSARSLRQCGPMNAMTAMLTARMYRARAARSIGLVDQVVGRHLSLRWAARNAVLKGRKSRSPGRMATLQSMAPARRLLAGQMRKQTRAKANPDHYPAPYELIDAFEAHGDDPFRMMAEEVTRVGRLITTPTSRNLRRIFRLTELLKGYGKEGDFSARRVHVVGAGTMGGDIAAWCVIRGLEVTLQDREYKYIEPALKRAEKLFKKRLRTPDQVAGARSRLIPDIEGAGVARADVVVEAIFENAEAKQALYRELEPRMQAHAILATNTSAIPLQELASVLSRPERLIGLHFFNPVAQMPLVEIVRDAATDTGQVSSGAAFCNQIGKFPLPVQSSPGFLVNRVLAPYLLGAFRLHQDEGVSLETLDRAATRFGMPMGPVELADVVGLDIGLSVLGTLGGADATAERELLQAKVDAGKLGKKSGEGFYRWTKGKAQKGEVTASPKDLQRLADRLMAPYFDECRACLEDGVVESADALDAGMVFGTGFAPFRGGPLHYLDSLSETSSDTTQAQPAQASKEDAAEAAQTDADQAPPAEAGAHDEKSLTTEGDRHE